MGRIRLCATVGMFFCLGLAVLNLRAQSAVEAAASASRPAESLYLQLQSVGLDSSRVYRVRDASIDRAAVHITFEDGTLAFTRDVAGRVTGAFFEGDGEILLAPPNRVERSSMALFTGAAILEETFVTGYFRFNDDTFAQMKPFFREAANAKEFVSEWNETAVNLAGVDALRLLMTFSNGLPAPDGAEAVPAPNGDLFWHARVQGRKLGAFDAYYDSDAPEQVWVGQVKASAGQSFYEMWTSFPAPLVDKQVPSAKSALPERMDAVNITSYKIKSEIKLPTSLSAEAWLQLEVRQGGQRTVLFELSRFLQLKSVEADGHPIECIHNQAIEGTQLARRGNDLVAAVFPRSLRSGERIELHFVYAGDVLSEAGGGLLYVGARGTWFPNRRLAMANFDLEFRYPAGWTLVATGKKAQEPSPKEGEEQVGRWISERPMPLAGFNLGKYKRVSAHTGETQVETYAAAGVEQTFPKAPAEVPEIASIAPFGSRQRQLILPITPPPPSPARNAQTVADISARAIEFFSQRFGPYPYSTLSVTQQPGAANQGWPGLIFLSSFSFLTDAEKTELHLGSIKARFDDGVIAHETAHQWWGDLIVWGSYRDQWIMEALADYSSLMLLESDDPKRFHSVLAKYRDDLLQENKEGKPLLQAGPVTLGLRLCSSQFPEGYNSISYGRGAWMFHMLRTMMHDAEVKAKRARPSNANGADEPFVRALRRVREQYSGKAITTAQLLQVFEQELPAPVWHEGHKSLDWFYDSWINGTAIPRFEMQGVKYLDKGGGTLVIGKIVTKDAPADLITPVPIYATVGGKSVLLGRVFVDEPETTFHLNAPAGARRVVLDPNQTLLTRSH
jgi:hypothetical protein